MKRFLVALVILKIIVSFLYCFVGFVHPHITRQSVTLAVNQRFVIDWQHHEKNYAWLPRSLAGGDKDAILETEFPLLNYLTVPAFMGFQPATARVVARLMCLFLMTSVWFLNFKYWRKINLLGINCEIPSLILILLPIGGIYFQRFMPDFFSALLCTLALGISISHSEKIFWPFVLATLGLWVKPTSLIAFAPLLLLPNPVSQIKSRLKWLIPSAVMMLGYYLFAIKWVRSLSDLDRYYMTDVRNPWLSLVEFFSKPWEAVKMFIQEISVPFLPVITVGYWIYNKFSSPNLNSYKLWGILVLQFFTIVLLDGAHSLIHPYYYVGLSMTAAMLWYYYFQMDNRKVWQVLMIAPLFFFNVEHSFYELRDGVSPREKSTEKMWESCEKLKARHPDWPWSKGYSFRSEATPVSELGLCFAEIQGSLVNPYGFFLVEEKIPDDCTKTDQEGEVILVECTKK